MASEKMIAKKQQAVETLTEQLKNSVAGVLVDYKGINVENDTKLRKELREAGIEYTVVKNSLLTRACDIAGFEGLKSCLTGTTALALSKEDPVVAAKILAKYTGKESSDPFQLKAGFVDGDVLDAAGVLALSKLPSKEELIAKMLGSMNAPISGLVNVLNANLRGLAIVISEIAKKSA